jgi:hypothetical protein
MTWLTKKQGAFLTLGMTFISILILTLGSAMLRNAEYSEERVFEIGGMDRIHNLKSSILESYRDMHFLIFNMTVIAGLTQESVSIDIPGVDNPPLPQKEDARFVEWHKMNDVFYNTITTMYPYINFTKKSIFLNNENQTSFKTIHLINITENMWLWYTYMYLEDGTQILFPPGLPAPSNTLILGTNRNESGVGVFEYNITIKSDEYNANISWEYFTPGNVPVNIEYYGKEENYSAERRLIQLEPLLPTNVVSQNITLNITDGPKPWPVITIGKPPLDERMYMIVQAMGYDITARVSVRYTGTHLYNQTMKINDYFTINETTIGMGVMLEESGFEIRQL